MLYIALILALATAVYFFIEAIKANAGKDKMVKKIYRNEQKILSSAT